MQFGGSVRTGRIEDGMRVTLHGGEKMRRWLSCLYKNWMEEAQTKPWQKVRQFVQIHF